MTIRRKVIPLYVMRPRLFSAQSSNANREGSTPKIKRSRCSQTETKKSAPFTLAARASSREPFGRAGDDAVSPMHGAAVESAGHGNMGSQHSARPCRTLLPCTAPNLYNSRNGHSNPCCRRASTMDKNMPIGRCQVAFRPASRRLRQKARWSACAPYLSPCRLLACLSYYQFR